MTQQMSEAIKQARYACEKLGMQKDRLYCIHNELNKVIFSSGKALFSVDFDSCSVMVHIERKKVYGGKFCD